MTEKKLPFLRLLLTPALRWCVRNSIGVRELTEVAKAVLVEVAAEELGPEDRTRNISRISMMTGVHRKDVTRIVREGPVANQPLDIRNRVLTQWEQDPEFLTAGGKPRVLGCRGEGCEFERLVRRVSKELYSPTLLAELERTGAVTRSNGRVRLEAPLEDYSKNQEKGLELLSKDLITFTEAVEENLTRPKEIRNLHLRTEFDNIDRQELPRIRQWLLEQGRAFHKRARTMLAKHDLDLAPKKGRQGGAKVTLVAVSFTNEDR